MNSTLSVAVLSGKGGVGKTNLSLNLACALYQAGFKNLLMDCDMALPIWTCCWASPRKATSRTRCWATRG